LEITGNIQEIKKYEANHFLKMFPDKF